MSEPDQRSTEHSSAGRTEPRDDVAPTEVRWKKPALLLGATVLAVFVTEAMRTLPEGQELGWSTILGNVPNAWTFAVPLMAILLAHELGHYVAARWHRVPASLPYFIPLPALSPFGTMGAVISMPGRIRSRDALLDIGAAGPLAGMVVAVPVLIVGLGQSEVRELSGPALQEGNCLLYMLLKRLVVGPIPPGHDVWISPAAFAGWAGLLVTALNMLPIGQLDGGHIAYALLGERQNRVARVLHWALPAVFLYNLWAFGQMEPGLVWLVWFGLLFLLKRFSGDNHPPTEPGQLSPVRRAIAIGCILLFVLLFMPTPIRIID
ncbi:MAG: site-2 protease family protein [Deltaproteobacteria bacterium]|jgi:membrane-associated protease RseP (regulator of RpoE activity)|nr:site-2 protease family protein [Deltaproteobacteria bacterium]MBW2533685.1 site-2 protease family protein [Deltaproteobacteria bacterium]